MIELCTGIDDDVAGQMIALMYEFVSEAKLVDPTKINGDAFIGLWRQLIKSGAGAMYTLSNEGRIVGAIGGVLSPCPYDGEPMMVESFWFVTHSERGGSSGIRLLYALMDWCRDVGAKRLVMAHLHTTTSEKAESFYDRLGFRKLETHYMMEL